jgi:hypothetical protein
MGLVEATQKSWVLLFTFVEDVLIYLFRFKLPPQILIGVVPKEKRDRFARLRKLSGYKTKAKFSITRSALKRCRFAF